MTTESRVCRDNADRCAQVAQTAPSEAIKKAFLKLAESWRAMAAEFERGDDAKSAPGKSH